MQAKDLLKFKKCCGYNLKNNILPNKEYFPSDSFALITLWKTTMTFSWFQRSIEGHKWLIPEWPCWMAKNACNSSFAVYRTCKEIWWSSLLLWSPFSCMKLPLDFLLRIFLSRIFWFLPPSLDGRPLYL